MTSTEMAPQADTPTTQVLLTVGTNELPVLVAACRLAKIYKKSDGVWPGFTFIHSAQTGGKRETEPERECKRIKAMMERELGYTFADDRVKLDDPYSPLEILSKVKEKLEDLRRQNPAVNRVCLAYTGGTKAMAVHSHEAVKECGLASVACYLDPRENRLVPKGEVQDERAAFAWEIQQLAQLHGFTTEFRSEEDTQRVEVSPVQPSRELVQLGQEMYQWFRKHPWRDLVEGKRTVAALPEESDYSRWFAKWKHAWSGTKGPEYRVFPRISTQMRRPKSLNWFAPDEAYGGQEWSLLTERIAGHFKAPKGWEQRGQSWTLNVAQFPEDSLIGLCQFVKHQFLELQAYAELEAALKEVDYDGGARVYHDVHFSRTGENRDLFSLDAVAVIGYQLFAVSCTCAASASSIRQAGFEVLHRARQVGGDHALAMVLCPVPASNAREIEDSLHDDIGVVSVPLAVQSIFDRHHSMGELFRCFLTKANVPFKGGAKK